MESCSRLQWVNISFLFCSICDVYSVSKVKPVRFNYSDLSRWRTEFEIVR